MPGLYKNDLYGEVKVAHADGKLDLRFGPAFTGDLEHWHYDTFRQVRGSERRQCLRDVLAKRPGQDRHSDVELARHLGVSVQAGGGSGTRRRCSFSERGGTQKFAGKYEIEDSPSRE